MFDDRTLNGLREAGTEAITNDGKHDHTLMPLQQDNVVFQQMFEYPVSDFEAEVGFYMSVFGFPAIALTDEYALFTHPERGYCISFRRAENVPTLSLAGLKLLFMTSDIPTADTHMELTGIVTDREFRSGSPVQRVIHFSTPAGVAVEIWEDPTPGLHE